MSKHKHVITAVIVTYLLLSFVPSLGLTSLFGGLKGGGNKGKIV